MSHNIDSTTYTGQNALSFNSTYVSTVASEAAIKRGAVVQIGSTFQVTTSFAENQSFATVPSGLRPAIRTYFPITGGKLGFVEPNGNVYMLNGASAGWFSLGITLVV